MPEYKLIYFNARGRAEISRWIMAYGNIPYTDERVEKADWPERKKSEYSLIKDLLSWRVVILKTESTAYFCVCDHVGYMY